MMLGWIIYILILLEIEIGSDLAGFLLNLVFVKRTLVEWAPISTPTIDSTGMRFDALSIE